MSEHKRLYGLDCLRGLAGLSVVAYHFLREYGLTFHDGDLVPWMDRYGHYGVEMFFIISGFVMFMTLERSPSLHRFIAARIARLAPAFYCCLAITTLVLVLRPLPQLPGPTPLKLLANLTMAPELFGQGAMDWSYWTLAYEFVFYAMIGALFLAGAMHRIDWFCLGWLAFAAALQCALSHIPQRVGEVLLIGYGQFFIIGVALRRFHAKEANWLTGLVLVFAIAMSLFGASWRAPTPGPLYTIVTLALTAVAWLAVTERIPRLLRTPLVWVSLVSYPLFLIHQFIGYEIIAALRAQSVPLLASLGTATVTSLGLAVLIYQFVEKPGRKRLRQVLGGRTAAMTTMPSPPSLPLFTGEEGQGVR